jgi:8-oxo-dGTP pyrophosphatase MutT (NUDIX family)
MQGATLTEKWNTLDSRTIIKDRWIDLRADKCVTPSGVDVSPYYVLSYPDWIHIVALTKDSDIVLVKQYRHAVGQVLLEIPGGMMDKADCDPIIAAKRELLEETGYAADSWRIVGSFFANPATHTNRVHVVLALNAYKQATPSLDVGEEGLVPLTEPVHRVLQKLADGLLPHAMHVAAVLLGLAEAGHLGLGSRRSV